MSFVFTPPVAITERERRIYFRRDDEPDYGKPVEEEIQPEGPWRFLPSCALFEIFSCLAGNDRFNAALVCSSWNEIFNHPNLWRKRKFKFYGYRKATEDMVKAMAFAKRFGQYLQILIISCEHPTFALCKKFQRTITDFMGVMSWRKCQLKQLVIPRLHCDRYWRYDSTRERLMASFARFLRKQQNLETFSMPDAGLNVQNGLHVLEALVTGAKARRKLKSLNLEDFFHSRLAIFRVGRFIHALNQLKNLKTFFINYNCLSEDVLNVIARTCAGSLKFLSIKVYKLDPHFHQIPSACWRKLTHACPGIRVNMYFECIGDNIDITRVLNRDVPLHSLHIWTGLHQQDEMWNLGDTLRYIGDSFGKVLEEMSLGLEVGRESIDEAFLYMLQKLTKLEGLDVQSELSLETVEQVLEMQQEHKIGLQKCHMNLDRMLPMEMEDLGELVELYEDMMDERGLDFRFEASETILL